MSRIGKAITKIPNDVNVTFEDRVLTVKGPKGTLMRNIHPEVDITITEEGVSVTPAKKTRLAQSLWGTFSSHTKNMVEGVTTGFKKELNVVGVGYRAELKGNTIVLRVGFSHEVEVPVPEGLTATVKDNTITIEGIDKELVGAFAARVRKIRKPEPYKGKGIRYSDEVVRRKQGKKAAK